MTETTSSAISFEKNPDGSLNFSNGMDTVTFPDPVTTKHETEVRASNGRALLAELRSRRHSLIETHHIDGRDWHLLKMNRPKTDEVAILTMALGDGTLDISRNVVLKALILATVQVGVVQGEKDQTPYFNPESYLQDDAYGNEVETTELEQANEEPEFSGTIAKLFDVLTDMNAIIFPQKKIVMEAGRKLMESWTSSPSMNGSSTDSEEPNSLPSSLESSANSEDETPPPSEK